MKPYNLTESEQKVLRILLQRPVHTSKWTDGERRIVRVLAKQGLVQFRALSGNYVSTWAVENGIYQ